jgi:hypothetical protein
MLAKEACRVKIKAANSLAGIPYQAARMSFQVSTNK